MWMSKYCWLVVMNSILFYLNTCKTLYLWCWKLVLWWVVVLEQAGGLHGFIRWFKYILGVFFISWKCEWVLLIRCVINILFDLNTCKTLYLWCWKLDLWWVVVLEQVGGLYGVIRWFKLILRVFFISCKCEWLCLIRCDE